MAIHPVDRFSRRHSIDMPIKAWERLPSLAGFKNEYWDGKAQYTPRRHGVNCFLDLSRWQGVPIRHDPPGLGRDSVSIHTLADEDWRELPPLFLGAFCDQPPLAEWGGHAALRASRCILEWTRIGRDGPLVREACIVARGDAFGGDASDICGAAVVTLSPAHQMQSTPNDAACSHPEDPNKQVVPHLNWVFIHRFSWRRGIGTLLLDEVAAQLKRLGYRWLASFCSLANGASLAWHWRNGFQLPPDDQARFKFQRAAEQPDVR